MTTADLEYQPFPNETGRNWRQEHLEIPLMLLALELSRGARVLEVGCGRGVALPPLARQLAPAHLVGVDIDPALIAEARVYLRNAQLTTRAELVSADVRRLPFSAGSFELVIDFGTCFHIARRDEALREIARVLAPAGVLVTETRLSQLLSHPVRSRGRWLPWAVVPELAPRRRALLWESYRRCGP